MINVLFAKDFIFFLIHAKINAPANLMGKSWQILNITSEILLLFDKAPDVIYFIADHSNNDIPDNIECFK